MNSLARIPVWVWYLFSVAFCYAIWNPRYSMWQLMASDVSSPVKVVIAIVALIIVAMYISEGHKSLNAFAIILFFSLIGAMMWAAFEHGARFGYYEWWGQWVIGLFMTIAAQGGRIYRSLFGRVPVGGVVEHDGGHHG